MSILLIDVGNTRSKYCVINQDSETPVADFMLDDVDMQKPEAIYLSSVAGDSAIQVLQERLHQRWHITPRLVRSTDDFPGINTDYRDPAKLGVDRMLAVLAARNHTDSPCCVVDCGTAVTVDFVDGLGVHKGGFILPGLQMMRASLLHNTAVPHDTGVSTADLFPLDTSTAIAMGGRLAVAALVNASIDRADLTVSADQVSIVLGGGDAALVAPLMTRPYTLIQNLVLQGLAVLARLEAN